MSSAYTRFLTASALSRQPSPIRVLTGIQALAGPELISLAAGAPNPNTFPFESFSVKINGKSIDITGKQLNAALQYSPTPGTGKFLGHLRNLQSEIHDFQEINHNICVTTGSQDGLGKVMEALISPGDKVLVDTPIYSGTLAALRPLNPDLIGIKTDGDGLDMADLVEKFENGIASGAKILITVVNGSNPTGGSLSSKRREKLLELAEKHDLFIIEDDPYYWLDFQDEKCKSLFKLNQELGYTENAPDGRVLRSDSLSKIVSSGLRIGWLTGPKQIIERVILHQQATTMHTPTLNQELVSILFDEWATSTNSSTGTQGFINHTQKVTSFYRTQCDAILESCEKHLKGIATWNRPKAGMFLWLTVPDVVNTKKLIEAQALENNVLLVPGQAFMPNDEVTNTCRLSFSQETPERMDEAVRRLGEMIKRDIEGAKSEKA